MFRLRSRLTVAQPSEARIVLRSNPTRRILFGIVGALLIVAFVIGVDWQEDFQSGSVAGSIIYFFLTATCVGVAAWGNSVHFDNDRGTVAFVKSVFGIEVRKEQMPASEVDAVTIQGIQFLKESERPQAGLLNSRFRAYLDKRNTYYKLFLDFGEKRRFVEDSTELADLEGAATAISRHLDVSYKREDI
jgi:hypothetical protein